MRRMLMLDCLAWTALLISGSSLEPAADPVIQAKLSVQYKNLAGTFGFWHRRLHHHHDRLRTSSNPAETRTATQLNAAIHDLRGVDCCLSNMGQLFARAEFDNANDLRQLTKEGEQSYLLLIDALAALRSQ